MTDASLSLSAYRARLTNRDNAILDMLAEGLNQAEIARRVRENRNVVSGVVFRARAAGDTRVPHLDREGRRKAQSVLQKRLAAERPARIAEPRAARPVLAPKPAPLPPPIAQTRSRLTVTPTATLGDGGCRFICGEINGLDTPTCGRPQRPGSPWCASCAPFLSAPQTKRAL